MSHPSTTPSNTAVGGWNLDQSYTALPDLFFQRIGPTAAGEPTLVAFNESLAADLGVTFDSGDADQIDAMASMLAGNTLPPNADPIAQAYAGHQFGGFTMLGDGRAILLGEQITPNGRRFDIQLKGSGRTRYSRGGDGRAALEPMLREYLISEAMHALAIPTTRSLAVVASGQNVQRERPLPGAVLTRVSAGHVRVGTFQYAAATGDTDALKALADYVIDRHVADLHGRDDRYLELLAEVARRQASLVARWMLVGFVHGVMNTDNVSIVGETIDYGPCAFMDRYDLTTVFSSIDSQGRYAYGNQPAIMQWNLARFAETLLPLIDDDADRAVAAASEVIESFESMYHDAWLAGMRRKLGLSNRQPGDAALVESLLGWMSRQAVDYTNTFVDLSLESVPVAEIYRDPDFVAWHDRWTIRRGEDGWSEAESLAARRAANPVVIPRNHVVEAALHAAGVGNWGPWNACLEALQNPYRDPADDSFRSPPPEDAPAYRTFCGT